jgi:aldose 1-epimerase
MDVISLSDGRGTTAKIAPSVGFNCFDFQARVGDETVSVIDGGGSDKPSGHGIPILFPFPNRIRSGRFSWNGKDYHIPESNASYNAGNAIHGFCLDRPWRVTSHGPDFAAGTFQLSRDAADRASYWPTDFRIEVRYSVRDGRLRADFLIVNPATEPLPWGLGTHPYFKLPLSAKSKAARCLISAPAAQEWELIDCLPTGRVLAVSESKDLREGAYFDTLKLDDVLTGLGNAPVIECGIMDEQAGLQITQRFPKEFRELVVFTPHNRDAFCLEPYTCVTDAINLAPRGVETGWRVLDPSAEFRTWIEISAGEVIA